MSHNIIESLKSIAYFSKGAYTTSNDSAFIVIYDELVSIINESEDPIKKDKMVVNNV